MQLPEPDADEDAVIAAGIVPFGLYCFLAVCLFAALVALVALVAHLFDTRGSSGPTKKGPK